MIVVFGCFERVPKRFGGMRDLVYFSGEFGIRAKNRSWKREFQLRAGAGAGFRVFKGSGCENRKGKVAGYGISIFYYFLRDCMN